MLLLISASMLRHTPIRLFMPTVVRFTPSINTPSEQIPPLEAKNSSANVDWGKFMEAQQKHWQKIEKKNEWKVLFLGCIALNTFLIWRK